MMLSYENRRLSTPDASELALTAAQERVFAVWEEGFAAHARGVPFDGHPHYQHWAHKVRKVWQEGWLASAAVERLAAEL